MPRIFISHSSANNAFALALRDWLIAEGWDDLFLDLDPERGIVAGERWERALNEAALRCEAVLFLVSREWLASRWCLKEFHLASKLNKRTFGLLIDGLTIAELPAEITIDWQLVDLASGRDHVSMRAVTPNGGAEEHVTFSRSGLARLKAGLRRAGLDPKFFAWPPEKDPDRPPYRGLKALEAEDAGIFFGREAETIAVLDRLRGLREAAPPRFLAILGASGAGKSSFLRAGVLPRLSRDDRNFLPLPVIRPERLPISGEAGLLRSLTTAFATARLGVTRAQVQAAITSGAPSLLALLGRLAEASRVPAAPGEPASEPPTLVLSIDQGEELFLAESAAEAVPFLTLLKDIAGAESPKLIVLVAIRSDAYERLQSASELDGLRQETFSLPPLPRGSYQSVIEGPAKRFRQAQQRNKNGEVSRLLNIEPALTQALLTDIEAGGAKDALPLLAFTLERLYVDHVGKGSLTLADYRQTGGVKGSIEAAVERAMQGADGDARVPRDRGARLALMRRALIPWLAGIDPETGSPRRRVARLTEVPEEARPLVEHLINARLLSTDIGENGETTIEPAHEALLRQWGLLEGWLQEDFNTLTVLDALKRAARVWDSNARHPDWLTHSGSRLDEANRLGTQQAYLDYLDSSDRAYLSACLTRQSMQRDRELADARRFAEEQKKRADAERLAGERTKLGLLVACALLCLAYVAMLFSARQSVFAQESEFRSRLKATQATAQKAQDELRSGDVITASMALAANANLIDLNDVHVHDGSLDRAMREQLWSPRLIYSFRGGYAALSASTWVEWRGKTISLRSTDESGSLKARNMPGPVARVELTAHKDLATVNWMSNDGVNYTEVLRFPSLETVAQIESVCLADKRNWSLECEAGTYRLTDGQRIIEKGPSLICSEKCEKVLLTGDRVQVFGIEEASNVRYLPDNAFGWFVQEDTVLVWRRDEVSLFQFGEGILQNLKSQIEERLGVVLGEIRWVDFDPENHVALILSDRIVRVNFSSDGDYNAAILSEDGSRSNHVGFSDSFAFASGEEKLQIWDPQGNAILTFDTVEYSNLKAASILAKRVLVTGKDGRFLVKDYGRSELPDVRLRHSGSYIRSGTLLSNGRLLTQSAQTTALWSLEDAPADERLNPELLTDRRYAFDPTSGTVSSSAGKLTPILNGDSFEMWEAPSGRSVLIQSEREFVTVDLERSSVANRYTCSSVYDIREFTGAGTSMVIDCGNELHLVREGRLLKAFPLVANPMHRYAVFSADESSVAVWNGSGFDIAEAKHGKLLQQITIEPWTVTKESKMASGVSVRSFKATGAYIERSAGDRFHVLRETSLSEWSGAGRVWENPTALSRVEYLDVMKGFRIGSNGVIAVWGAGTVYIVDGRSGDLLSIEKDRQLQDVQFDASAQHMLLRLKTSVELWRTKPLELMGLLPGAYSDAVFEQSSQAIALATANGVKRLKLFDGPHGAMPAFCKAYLQSFDQGTKNCEDFLRREGGNVSAETVNVD